MSIKNDMKLTPHFALREFLKNGSAEGVTPEIMGNLKKLAEALEEIRALCGSRPITINSGFRTAAHNRAVGGASKSQHLYGKAADIVVKGLAPAEVQRILKDWRGGLGSYHVFTHVDIGPKRRWDGA